MSDVAVGEPMNVIHCHCGMCRKAAGAPMVTFVSFPSDKVTFTGAQPAIYQSSPEGKRGFCENCGGALTFQYTARPERVSVTAGSLDHPEAVSPRMHYYEADRVPWLRMDDDLLRHEGHG